MQLEMVLKKVFEALQEKNMNKHLFYETDSIISVLCRGVTDGDRSTSGVTTSQLELQGVKIVGIRLAISGLLIPTVSS
ncbi:hypothetical protein NQ317_019054 [Molorchus minor]|uniref:Uncharacterized protein n=1 Tax=Molorchus minor TaxID=1323400 RepID=A0ABQ9JWE6_9CUCU|nr:hypothetical protein NQ317_019054 [Molorchus minor]